MSSMCLISLLLLGRAGPSGQIAYLAGTEQEDLCVCVLDVATGAVTRVGPGECDRAPVWSPDGAWIAFATRHASEGVGIELVRADGSQRRRIAHAYSINTSPRWSPDGTRLLYSSRGPGAGIMVYDLRTRTETEWNAGETRLMRPVWVENMKLLYSLKQLEEAVYGVSRLEGLAGDFNQSGAVLAIGLIGEPGRLETDIFIATASGALPIVPAVLNPGDYVEWAVEINREGSMIAFESNDGGDREIFVFSQRGLADVSNHRAADWNPVWSPDGDWLAFESFRNGRRGIYRVYPETVRVFPVAVSQEADSWHPAWSPDGAWVAFVSDRTGDPEIYVTDVGGKQTQQLTFHAGPDYAPAWRPEPK